MSNPVHAQLSAAAHLMLKNTGTAASVLPPGVVTYGPTTGLADHRVRIAVPGPLETTLLVRLENNMRLALRGTGVRVGLTSTSVEIAPGHGPTRAAAALSVVFQFDPIPTAEYAPSDSAAKRARPDRGTARGSGDDL